MSSWDDEWVDEDLGLDDLRSSAPGRPGDRSSEGSSTGWRTDGYGADPWDDVDLDEWAAEGEVSPKRGWVVVVGMVVLVPFVLTYGMRGFGAIGPALVVIVGFFAFVGLAYAGVVWWLRRQEVPGGGGPAEWSDRR